MNKNTFIKNSAQPELAKAVLNQCTEEWKDIVSRTKDFLDASTGVSGFIYYSDTVAFAQKHLVLITNALNALEEDLGDRLDKPTDETGYYNWMSWFALELIMNEIDSIKNGQFS